MQGSDKPAILQGINLVKHFGDLVAVNGVSVSVRSGEIAALLGENGAGKSTYLKLLNGFLKPTSGEIMYEGQKTVFRSAHEAAKKKIYTIYQNFALIDKFTISENLQLAFPEKSQPELKEIANRYGKFGNLDVRVNQLQAGTKQRLEITKALASDAKVLLLDEPTSVLAHEERGVLFKELDRLRDEQGMAVLIATHKLQDVLDYCDRVSVMRGGKLVIERLVKGTTMADLTTAMFGASEEYHPSEEKIHAEKDRILDAVNVSVKGDTVPLVVNGASLSLYRNEILGIIGVAGNGQIELADAIFGLRQLASGKIELTQEAMKLGRKLRIARVGYISDDPIQVGLAVNLSVSDNFGISIVDQVSNGMFVDYNALDAFSDTAIQQFGIKCSSLDTPLLELSGGNIQKVSVARELERKVDVLIAIHPAKGLDLHTTYLVYRRIKEIADSGVAVLLISEDVDELLDLADYIGVMYEGHLSEIKPRGQCTKHDIGRIMVGGHVIAV